MDHVSPAARLSNYRLDRLLGSGGMGTVYLAQDLALDRPVAIKFISTEKASDESSRRRLIREARAAAALDHPNICGVHEIIVEPDGRACIVMQYLDGQTLAERLRAGPLDSRLSLAIATDVGEALAAAHAHGIVHRDVKPQNIMLTAANVVKLLDFGLAVHSRGDGDAARYGTTASLSSLDALAGTLPYMSPEQVAQRRLDGRSDLFSLGTVLFECFTGQRPFTGRSTAEVASQILHHDPAPVSSLRPDLGEPHDELCRRLLAKHPDDRFRSAEELLGAVRVVSGGSSSSSAAIESPPQPSRRRRVLMAVAATAGILALAGIWQWKAGTEAFVASPEAVEMYARGTEWIRDGAYHSGQRMLDRAVGLAPGYVPAHVRLAEAFTELDDHRSAQDALNTVAMLTPDEDRLSDEDRLRVRAVRALMLRRVDTAVAEYGRLTELKPEDSGSWVDLGRAQETAALPVQARASFDQAIQLESENAAAHLRRATVVSQMGDRDDALRAFDVADALYKKLGNVEGRTEALLRRGTYLNGVGALTPAREALERAASLAETLEHPEQLIRAQLQLSSITASEGAYGQAQTIAMNAVEAALLNGLDTVAAEGLIDLANALFQARLGEAPDPRVLQSIDTHLERAIRLAERRNAQRIVARATMQRAALLAQFEQPAEALKLAGGVLEFLRTNHYRRYELQLLLIMSRSLEYLGRTDEGRQMSEEGLRVAEQVQDDAQAAFALENLAGFAVAAGNLPSAEAFRKRAEFINRRQNNLYALPYDLTNRAELLIRLGRGAEADALLSEVEAGAVKGIESFKERERRAQSLRALRATVDGQYLEAARIAGQVVSGPAGVNDSAGKLAVSLLVYSQARLGREVTADLWRDAADGGATAGEARYWSLFARIVAGDPRTALAGAVEALQDNLVSGSPELQWRMAALGAWAARELKQGERLSAVAPQAADSLQRLRADWKDHASTYLRRADIADLLENAGLNPQPSTERGTR